MTTCAWPPLQVGLVSYGITQTDPVTELPITQVGGNGSPEGLLPF